MKIVLHCLFCLLLLPAAICKADTPEVTASRTAAEKHNETIQDASQRLEKAIAAAHREHAKQIVSAKERMVVDLRRAYRTALRGDTPENAGTIERQIKRLEAQIEALKSEAKTPPEPPEVKLKGLDPRLVGFILVSRSPRYGCIYEVDTRGRVNVRYTAGGQQPGFDTGRTYQGVIKDGRLFVHAKHWTERGRPNGRVRDFLITEDGDVEIRESTFEIHKANGFGDQGTFRKPIAEILYAKWEDIPAQYRGGESEESNELGDDDIDPDFVEEEEDGVDKNLDEEIDFFGIPIK